MSKVRRCGLVTAGTTLAFCLGGFGCSRTSLLLESGENATGGASQAGKTFGGSNGTGTGVTGGTFSQGGTFGSVSMGGFQSGGFQGGGFPNGGFQSGGFPNGGFPSGGQTNDTCGLAVGDCRLASDAGCEGFRHECEGVLLAHLELGTVDVSVDDVATATSGRVAIAGSFVGTLALGGQSQPVSTGTKPGPQAFVASFDSAGQAEWVKMYESVYTGRVTGMRFSPKGNVIAQLIDDSGMAVVQLDARGNIDWSLHSTSAVLAPGRVGVDNDGNVLLTGTYTGQMGFANSQLAPAANDAGYLFKLNDAAELLWARTVPSSWSSARPTSLVVDDEDSVLVSGVGRHADTSSVNSSFLRKYSPTGLLVFSNELDASEGIEMRGLAVDREMRPIVAGQFEGEIQLEDATFVSGSDGPDLLVAQYSREGKLNWRRAYPSDQPGAYVDSAAVDPFGNIVIAGNAKSLTVDELEPLSSSGSLYALKLRPDGTPVWLRSFAGSTGPTILASDIKSNFWLGCTFNSTLELDTDVLESNGAAHGLLLKLGP